MIGWLCQPIKMIVFLFAAFVVWVIFTLAYNTPPKDWAPIRRRYDDYTPPKRTVVNTSQSDNDDIQLMQARYGTDSTINDDVVVPVPCTTDVISIDCDDDDDNVRKERITRENVHHNGFEFGNWAKLNENNVDVFIPFIESGVYELGILGREIAVCYVGMTAHLNERLRTHHRGFFIDRNGKRTSNNTTYVITTHRKKGRIILFRVLPTTSREEANRIESTLLAKYDYAWNILDNGKDRRRKIKGF